MSWYSPRLGGSSQGSSDQETIIAPNGRSLTVPETPESVKDVGVAVCYDVGAFRELMRQYRQLDDGVTTRLNRALARSRSSGLSSAPSLLNNPATNSSGSDPGGKLADLGTSTYSSFSQNTCLGVWRELSSYWRGREDVIRFCVKVVDAGAEQSAKNAEGARQAQRLSSRPPSDTDLLDADQPAWTAEQQRQFHNQHTIGGYERVSRASSPDDSSIWDARGSRAESSEDGLRRHLHNEEAVDQIIRNRSLQAFKSRCNLFRLPPDATEWERRIWEQK